MLHRQVHMLWVLYSRYNTKLIKYLCVKYSMNINETNGNEKCYIKKVQFGYF